MKKILINFTCLLLFNSVLYTMEKNGDKSVDESCVEKSSINKLPFELVQKICLLTQTERTDVCKLINMLLKLRINRAWSNAFKHELFWKYAFTKLFENIIDKFGLSELKKQILKCKRLVHLVNKESEISEALSATKKSSEIYLIIKKCLEELINDEQFWKITFKDFFIVFMLFHKNCEVRNKIAYFEKELEAENENFTMPWLLDSETLSLWLKIISPLAKILEDVKCNSEIRHKISKLELAKAIQLIEVAKKNNEYEFWNFDLIQTTIHSIENLSTFSVNRYKFFRERIIKVIRYLLNEAGISVDSKGFQGRTALMYAVANELSDITEVLMEYKPNIQTKNVKGMSALTYSVVAGNLEVFERLIKNGAKASDKSWTIAGNALGFAVFFNKPKIVEKLLKDGAEVNVKFLHDFTILMLAAQRGYVEIAEMLIAKGADLNAKNVWGFTALMIACDRKQFEMIELLQNAGADANIRGKRDETALKILSQRFKKREEEQQRLSKSRHGTRHVCVEGSWKFETDTGIGTRW